MTAVAAATPATRGWRSSAELAARRLAPIAVAGALLGVLVGGVGGRLAMMLLAALNPSAAGVTSDDGFTIGQFTLAGTGGLLVVGWLLGMVGAGFYALLRGLMIGPQWFRLLSVSAGAGIVVGSMLVHTDGVDFRLLKPLWLSVGLFIAIPTVFVALLSLVAEHWIRTGDWFARASLPWLSLTLLLWVPVAPLLLALIAAWSVAEWLRRHPSRWLVASTPALPWLARGALTAVFLFAVIDLISDLTALA